MEKNLSEATNLLEQQGIEATEETVNRVASLLGTLKESAIARAAELGERSPEEQLEAFVGGIDEIFAAQMQSDVNEVLGELEEINGKPLSEEVRGKTGELLTQYATTTQAVEEEPAVTDEPQQEAVAQEEQIAQVDQGEGTADLTEAELDEAGLASYEESDGALPQTSEEDRSVLSLALDVDVEIEQRKPIQKSELTDGQELLIDIPGSDRQVVVNARDDGNGQFSLLNDETGQTETTIDQNNPNDTTRLFSSASSDRTEKQKWQKEVTKDNLRVVIAIFATVLALLGSWFYFDHDFNNKLDPKISFIEAKKLLLESKKMQSRAKGLVQIISLKNNNAIDPEQADRITSSGIALSADKQKNGANLFNAKLQNANLKDAELQNANLQGAELQNANLQGANLQGAYLQDANLQRANLKDANLKGAYLREANLKDAILQSANLKDTWLRDVNLQGANLENANLENASPEDTNLKHANLSYANLQDASLYRADLQGANLKGANLKDAYLDRANLWRADLQDADLRGATLEGVFLVGANLENANLQDVWLRNANLQGADLQDANLQGARYDAETQFPEGFDPKQRGMIKE